MTGSPLIEFDTTSHRFQSGVLGLDRVTLKVDAGEFVVIAGRNGSGKTTILRHLNGLLVPTSGSVKLLGAEVGADLLRARQMVGMVFQNADSQIVGETVADDVSFGPENLCLKRDEVERRVDEALEAVGLGHMRDQRPHLLSGGEKRRLAVAGVLAMEPLILAFDEPFSSLDYPGVRQVLENMIRLHARGHTILITTHDLEKIFPHADRLVVMDHGRVVRDGPPDSVVEDVEGFGVRQPWFSRFGMEAISWLR
ncbi:energy-coupling factor ABC transporter ATP-binding protein [Thermodesulfobacteriota bacterium]